MSDREESNVTTEQKDRFESLADRQSTGLVREFIDFLQTNKRWWLIPVVLFLLGIGVLVIASSNPLAPFIYTLF